MNSGDTAFMLVSAALVMLMTPGLALFYGGMVRSKNVLATIMENFILLGVISVLWAIYGYSLAFGPDVGHFIGNLDWIGLAGVGFEPFKAYAETIPHQTFMIYQAMFAIITPALITGAFAERMKFSAFLVFMVLWSTIVYCPVAHWVWGDGGWLKNLGALDFAGGTVVHINAGIAALAAALVVGRRQGYRQRHASLHSPQPAHDHPGGGASVVRLVRVQRRQRPGRRRPGLLPPSRPRIWPPAAATLSWVGRNGFVGASPPPWARPPARWPGWWPSPRPRVMWVPCPPSSSAWWPGSSAIWRCWPNRRLGYDDSLDVVGVHCVGGIVGALCTGLFATKLVNAGRRRRPVLRQSRPARDPVHRGGRDPGLLLRGQLHSLQNPGRHHGTQGNAGRRGGRPGSQRTSRNRLQPVKYREAEHEKDRGNYPALQAGAGKGSPPRHQRRGHDGHAKSRGSDGKRAFGRSTGAWSTRWISCPR